MTSRTADIREAEARGYQSDDLWALNEALAPFDPIPAAPDNADQGR